MDSLEPTNHTPYIGEGIKVEKDSIASRQRDRLLKPEMSERVFKMYKKGKSIKHIVKKSCTTRKALRDAFPSLNFGQRGKITFFKSKKMEDKLCVSPSP